MRAWPARRTWLRWSGVALGGALGALARLGVGAVLPSGSGSPWATLGVNVSGAFALGVLGTLLTERLNVRAWWRTFLGIGFLGAYTTFSTMAVEGVTLLAEGRPGLALGYWAATLVLGQMAGVYGMWLGRLERPGKGGPGDDARG